ncbi:MAG: hypothetical protein PHX61_10235 [Alphaproteobacteria bacterium]|nr:hypothetical protein [Alphaproteobacteria bacterium]
MSFHVEALGRCNPFHCGLIQRQAVTNDAAFSTSVGEAAEYHSASE